MTDTVSYDIEFSFTYDENDHLNIGATRIDVDHEITTTDDIKTIAAEIGRQNGYKSVKIMSIIPTLDVESEPVDSLGTIDPDELFS